MIWHHLSRHSKWIDKLYGDTPPTLRTCRLSEVLITDNNAMILTLHIDQMPPEHLWPTRWDKGCNRVAIELSLSEIRAVHIEGWSANNLADVEIHRSDDGGSLVLTASESWGRITTRFGWLSLGSLEGYRAEDGYEDRFDAAAKRVTNRAALARRLKAFKEQSGKKSG
jgi:Immunity protein 50